MPWEFMGRAPKAFWGDLGGLSGRGKFKLRHEGKRGLFRQIQKEGAACAKTQGQGNMAGLGVYQCSSRPECCWEVPPPCWASIAVLRSLNLILTLFQIPQYFGAQLCIPRSGPHSSPFEMHSHHSCYLDGIVHVPKHTHFTFSGTVPFTRVPRSEQRNPNFCSDKSEFMHIA